MHFLVLHGRQIDASHVTMHTYHGRQAGREMQVRGLILDAEGKQFCDIHYNVPVEVAVRYKFR